MVIVIESGNIYPLLEVVLIGLYASKNFGQYIIVDATNQIIVSTVTPIAVNSIHPMTYSRGLSSPLSPFVLVLGSQLKGSDEVEPV
jgi:hypothetical protein